MQKYRVIGMMSGTSVDGLDIAYCEFQTNDWNQFDYSILKSETINYPENLKSQLISCISFDGQKLGMLDMELGTWMGTHLLKFITANQIEPCLVASHGHTVLHQPENGFTLQIGNGQKMHQITKFPVIYDFRVLDVTFGGQGAPLVPIGDQLLFPHYDFCLNLGGFANISFHDGYSRKAFDIGAVNIVLNELTSLIHLSYDENGLVAREGTSIPNLLDDLNQLSFYDLPFPKSIGKEWVEAEVMPIIYPYLKDNRTEDIISTYTIHIGKIIARTLTDLSAIHGKDGSSLVTGGGAHNSYLQEIIQNNFLDLKLEKPDNQLIEFKEALVFALMGLLRSQNLVNCLKSVTGASINTSGGIIIGKLP